MRVLRKTSLSSKNIISDLKKEISDVYTNIEVNLTTQTTGVLPITGGGHRSY